MLISIFSSLYPNYLIRIFKKRKYDIEIHLKIYMSLEKRIE